MNVEKPEELDVDSYELAYPWIKFFTANIISSYQELTAKGNINELKVIEIIRKQGKEEDGIIVCSQGILARQANFTKRDAVETLETLEMKNLIRKMIVGKKIYWGIAK